MEKSMPLEDKVVVVTGGAGGIGFATARLASQAGATPVTWDLDASAVNEAASMIRAAGGEALGVVGDVSSHASVKENVDEIMNSLDRFDVLINNAATQVNVPAGELSEGHWRRELDMCLTGAFFWSQAVGVSSMIPRQEGSIVNVGSGAGLAATPNSASYIAAKHGVVGLTKALAVDGLSTTFGSTACGRGIPGQIWPRASSKRIPK